MPALLALDLCAQAEHGPDGAAGRSPSPSGAFVVASPSCQRARPTAAERRRPAVALVPRPGLGSRSSLPTPSRPSTSSWPSPGPTRGSRPTASPGRLHRRRRGGRVRRLRGGGQPRAAHRAARRASGDRWALAPSAADVGFRRPASRGRGLAPRVAAIARAEGFPCMPGRPRREAPDDHGNCRIAATFRADEQNRDIHRKRDPDPALPRPRRRRVSVTTGVGFFDHMLELLGRHGRLGPARQRSGDLETGAHHTVEDVGIALGQALDQALGDRPGIRRYGYTAVPMDEALGDVRDRHLRPAPVPVRGRPARRSRSRGSTPSSPRSSSARWPRTRSSPFTSARATAPTPTT